MPRAHSAAPSTPPPPKVEPEPAPRPNSAEARDLMTRLGVEKESVISPTVILAAIAALVVVIGGSIFLINDGPTPAELAVAADATTTEFVPPELGAWYCRNPVPRPDAPEPSEDVNTFLVFEHANGERNDSPLDVYAGPNEAEAAYALCLSGIEDGEDVVCLAEGGGTLIRYESMEWTANLVQLSTGETVFDTAVRKGPDPDCPFVAAERFDLIRADVDDLRYKLVPYALPTQFTERHLGNRLNANDGSWCDNGVALPELGTDRTVVLPSIEETDGTLPEDEDLTQGDPPSVYISGWEFVRNAIGPDVSISSADLGTISHIACVAAEWPRNANYDRCDYPDFILAYRPYDYRVTIVDAATGELVSTETFDGTAPCPQTVLYDSETEVRNAGIPDAVATFIETSLGIEPDPEDQDS